jgi:hypothetical protein
MKLEDDLETARDIRRKEAITEVGSGGMGVQGNTLLHWVGSFQVLA